jgi:hypothetical protein
VFPAEEPVDPPTPVDPIVLCEQLVEPKPPSDADADVDVALPQPVKRSAANTLHDSLEPTRLSCMLASSPEEDGRPAAIRPSRIKTAPDP